MNRSLDGVFFRVCRNGKWQSLCFSDLTEDEMNEVLKDRNCEWLKNLCVILGRRIREIGDAFNIITEAK